MKYGERKNPTSAASRKEIQFATAFRTNRTGWRRLVVTEEARGDYIAALPIR